MQLNYIYVLSLPPNFRNFPRGSNAGNKKKSLSTQSLADHTFRLPQRERQPKNSITVSLLFLVFQ